MTKATGVAAAFEKRGNKAAEEIAGAVVENPALLESVLEGTRSPAKRVKNAAAKTLKIVSESNPGLPYRRFDDFVDMLDSGDTILKWIGMDIIGNLARVDTENKINKRIISSFFASLLDPALVTAAHAVDNLGKIAANKPRYRRDITTKLLKAESVERNEDCRAILAGKVILAFSGYVARMSAEDRAKAHAYAVRHVANPRAPTRKKAEAFVDKLNRGPS